MPRRGFWFPAPSDACVHAHESLKLRNKTPQADLVWECLTLFPILLNKS